MSWTWSAIRAWPSSPDSTPCPSAPYLASYSSRVDRRACVRLMAAWFDEVRRAGLPRGDSIDLDFHAVPANTQEEPLEKHYLSSRSRSQQSVLVFLARDASARVLCYAHAGVAKDQKAAEVLRFADFWQERTGQPPAELVFDSQLTTYEQLHQLNQRGINFLTLRPPDAADAGADLEPARVGLAAHHLAGADPRLPHAARTGRARDASWLYGCPAANHRDRPGPRGPHPAADQQHARPVARPW